MQMEYGQAPAATGKNCSMLRILDMQDGLRQYARPNHWNAPDMVEVGNGKLTPGEDHAHFAIWYRLAVPLNASHDLRQMDPQITSLLTNG